MPADSHPDANTDPDLDTLADIDKYSRSVTGRHRDVDGNTDTRAVLADRPGPGRPRQQQHRVRPGRRASAVSCRPGRRRATLAYGRADLDTFTDTNTAAGCAGRTTSSSRATAAPD